MASYTVNGRPEIHATSLTVGDPETLVLSWDLAHLLLSPPPHETCMETLQTRFEVSQNGAQYEPIDDMQGFKVSEKDGLLFVDAVSVGSYRLRLQVVNTVTGKAVTELSPTLLTLEVTNAQDIALNGNEHDLITKVS